MWNTLKRIVVRYAVRPCAESACRTTGKPLPPNRTRHLLPMLILATASTNTPAFETVGISVTIEEITAEVSFDDNSGTDFFAKVRINGDERSNLDTTGQEALEDHDFIDTSLLNAGRSDWTFTKPVDPTIGSVPITIKILDDDDPFGFEQADVENGPGLNVDITLDLGTCTFSGELSGSCGEVITTFGDGEGDGNATLKFRVDIAGLNAGDGNFIHCLHEPLWPQPGEKVKIVAVALGDNLGPKIADEVQITFADGSSSNQVAIQNTFFAEFTSDPLSDPEFTYSCNSLIDLDGSGQVDSMTDEVAETGFRTVQVGENPATRAIPVLIAGSSGPDTLDVLLMADATTYTAGDEDIFERDAGKIVGLYYLSGTVFLRNQDKLNFWLANPADKGMALGADDGCRELPPNFSTEYTMANAGLILHRDPELRNCSRDDIAIVRTVESDDESAVIPYPGLGFGAIVHELGHALFGLLDEYCDERDGANEDGSCDGGYRQARKNPNVFESEAACQDDYDNEMPPIPTVCQSWISEADDTSGQEFWTYDSPIGDLMVDNLLPGYLDNRRIQGVFDDCSGC